ncbi:pentapeptide repeat-containing protein [Streptomyces olivaceoviridis]
MSEPVQAALTVLGRRPDRDEPFRLNLERTDLRGAVLFKAHLERAVLWESRLEMAYLEGARLEGAMLVDARLDWADLGLAHLEGASLWGSWLEGASLAGAHLEEADLEGARLEHVKHLTVRQLVAALPWRSTRLPAALAADDAVRARIAEVEEKERTRRR